MSSNEGAAILRMKDNNGRVYDIPALRGYSAYQVAVKHGYEGTEEEWLESLIGGSIKIDDEMSDTSMNLVPNKVIKEYIDGLFEEYANGGGSGDIGIGGPVSPSGDAGASADDVVVGKFIMVNGVLTEGKIVNRSSADITMDGINMYVPAGNYKEGCTKTFAVPTVSVNTPNISVSADGTITASVSQNAGYISGGTRMTSIPLGNVHDADFIPGNIKSGITIFGVTGTYAGSGSGGSSGDSTAEPVYGSMEIKDNGTGAHYTVGIPVITGGYLGEGTFMIGMLPAVGGGSLDDTIFVTSDRSYTIQKGSYVYKNITFMGPPSGTIGDGDDGESGATAELGSVIIDDMGNGNAWVVLKVLSGGHINHGSHTLGTIPCLTDSGTVSVSQNSEYRIDAGTYVPDTIIFTSNSISSGNTTTSAEFSNLSVDNAGNFSILVTNDGYVPEGTLKLGKIPTFNTISCTVNSGKDDTVLPTAGKYCIGDITIPATGVDYYETNDYTDFSTEFTALYDEERYKGCTLVLVSEDPVLSSSPYGLCVHRLTLDLASETISCYGYSTYDNGVNGYSVTSDYTINGQSLVISGSSYAKSDSIIDNTDIQELTLEFYGKYKMYWI